MLKKALLLILVVVLAGGAFMAISAHLDRPEMTVDEYGECTSAKGPHGPINCADIKEEDWGDYDIVKAYKPLPK